MRLKKEKIRRVGKKWQAESTTKLMGKRTVARVSMKILGRNRKVRLVIASCVIEK